MDKLEQHIVLIRDHSMSMRSLAPAAMKDFNSLIDTIRESAEANNVDTTVSIIECGYPSTNSSRHQLYTPFFNQNPIHYRNGSLVNVVTDCENINFVFKMLKYETPGSSTPLLDSVGKGIELGKKIRKDNKNIPVLVMAITDGGENSSTIWDKYSITNEFKELEKTDMWTFAFRCPKGYSRHLRSLGISNGNIIEWDQTEKGMQESTAYTESAVRNYYNDRTTIGATSTSKFFVNTDGLTKTDVKRNLTKIYPEEYHTGLSVTPIKVKVEQIYGPYEIGDWYYKLTKTETLQDSKMIIVKDHKTGEFYTGQDARDLLGLPHVGSVKIVPGAINKYEVFVQSMSVNRNLMPNTTMLRYLRRV